MLNSDYFQPNRFSKQIQPLPIKNRDNLISGTRSKQLPEIKPKTREKLLPINKSSAREADPFAVPNANTLSSTFEDPLRDNSVFQKRESGKGDFKIQNGKTLQPADPNNPYGPNWTKMVLRNHFDVSMETADESHGFKWKIRRIKNLRLKKSPDNMHDDHVDNLSPKLNPKGFSAPGGNKRGWNKKGAEGKNKKLFLTVDELPLGNDLAAENIFINRPAQHAMDPSDDKHDSNWLADALFASKLSDQRGIITYRL